MTPNDAVKGWFDKSAHMWSRIKTVSAIEAGTLAAAWYALYEAKHFGLALSVILLATVLLIVVALLTHRDKQYMDALENIAGSEFPKVDDPFIKGLSGRKIAVGLPILLVIANFFLFIVV